MAKKSKPKTRLTAEERRASILRAARDEFVKSGFGSTRTREIAERAGVNEALLFRHFASKDEMFTAAVVEPLIEIMGTRVSVEVVLEPGDPTDQQWARTRSTLQRLLEMMQSVVPLLGVVLFADSEAAKELYREQITPILDAGAERLRHGYGTWDHRPYDVDLMPRASMGMCLFVALDAHFTGKDLDVAKTAGELASLIMYGTSNYPAGGPESTPVRGEA